MTLIREIIHIVIRNKKLNPRLLREELKVSVLSETNQGILMVLIMVMNMVMKMVMIMVIIMVTINIRVIM